MPLRRSTRWTRPSEGDSQSSPNPKQKVGIRRTRGKTKRASSKESDAQNGVDDTNDDEAHDIIDLIDMDEAQRASTEQEVNVGEAHRGGSDSEEDGHSVSSLSSGPSIPRYTTHKNPESSPTMCSVCLKLHQKAKRMKRPMKDKLLDNGGYTGCVV